MSSEYFNKAHRQCEVGAIIEEMAHSLRAMWINPEICLSEGKRGYD